MVECTTPWHREEIIYAEMFKAIKEKDAASIERMLDFGADINLGDETALMRAARNGSTDIVKLLLSRGCDAKFSIPGPRHPSRGTTALHCAVRSGNLETVTLLLDAGADINICRFGRQSPLLIAVSNGLVDIVKLLLSRGARVDLRAPVVYSPPTGGTALHAAAIANNLELVELLLDSGANPNIRYKNGDTVLFSLASRIYVKDHLTALTNFSKFSAIVTRLVRSGADVNAKNKTGFSPLLRICESLLSEKRCFGPNSTFHHKTAVCDTICSQRKEYVDAFLQAGANPNWVSVGNVYPITLAVLANCIHLVSSLIRAGADATVMCPLET